MTKGKGRLSSIVKLLSSSGVIAATTSISFCPKTSRLPQRAIEAMQSTGKTGLPSWNLSPSRKVKL